MPLRLHDLLWTQIRICPGRFLAQQMTLLTIMSVLAVFTVDYAKDEDGNEIPVTGEHTVDVPMLRYVESLSISPGVSSLHPMQRPITFRMFDRTERP